MLRAAIRAAAVALCYALVAGWLTWPLAGHLSTHMPRNYPGWDFDQMYSGWVLAWETRALVEGNTDFADANIYYPEPNALFYGPLALGALPFFAPVFLVTGNPTLALNLVFLLGIALSATALHCVVRAWTGSHAAGFVAATAFLANRWVLLTLVPCVPHMAIQIYIPVIMFLAATAVLRWPIALALSALVVAQCLTDPVYVAPAVLAPLVLIAGLRVLRPATRGNGWRLAAIVAVAVVILVVVFLPYLAVQSGNVDLAVQTNWRRPRREWLDLPGGLFGPVSPLAMPTLAVALIAAAGAVIALRGWRGGRGEALAWGHAALWSTVGLLLSLPRNVRIAGSDYGVFFVDWAHEWVPALDAIRVPERLRVAALFGIAVLAGLAFAELMRHLPARRRGLARLAAAALVGAAMYVQYEYAIGQPALYGPRFPGGFKIAKAIDGASPVLAALRAHGGPTLELPLPAKRPMMAGPHAAAMYRSIFHRQPLLNGYSSYWPLRFPSRMRLAVQLPDTRALSQLRRATGVELILVRARPELHSDAMMEAERAPWLELAARGGRADLPLVARDDELLLFRVGDAPP